MAKSNLLSAVKVAKLKEPGRYADGGGLYLQVSKWQTKAWLFRFERDGRERQMGLGPADDVSLADARQRAKASRLLLLDGHDPIEHRKAARTARRVADAKHMTFTACAEAYIRSHSPGWRNPKHDAQWRSSLKNYAYPIIGRLPVAEIDTPLVLQVLRPIWNDKTETANRLRGRIEQILDWSRVSEFRTGDNPARWKGHLDHLLARKSKIAPTKHREALPFKETPKFTKQLRASADLSARALEFLILTAARTGEVRLSRPAEFDRAAKLWIVPASRTKSGREHRVPLTARAIEILDGVGAFNPDCEYVFPGRIRGAMSDMAMLKMLQASHPTVTVHGFRSTFKDWAAETTTHENIVTEMALAHVIGDETEAAYRRGDLFKKRRSLMDDWAAFCASERQNGVVVKLRNRRATI